MRLQYLNPYERVDLFRVGVCGSTCRNEALGRDAGIDVDVIGPRRGEACLRGRL